jgi:hypothetical protein
MGKMKKLILSIIISLTAFSSHGQLKLKRMVVRKTAEAALMLNGGLYNTSARGIGANIHYMWGIGRQKQRLNVGLGIREYSFWAQKREYETSSADYYKFLQNGTDSIYFDKMQSNILNGYLALQFHIKRGIELGANIDLGGVTFGGTKEGFFHSYELTQTAKKKVAVNPFGFNVNSYGANGFGYGSTFNQLYLQFRGGQIMRYRLGLDYFRNEVITRVPVVGNGTRFKNNSLLVMGAIVWNIRHNKSKYDIWNFQD